MQSLIDPPNLQHHHQQQQESEEAPRSYSPIAKISTPESSKSKHTSTSTATATTTHTTITNTSHVHSSLSRHRLSVSHEDINFENVDPGTIRIDCSGAFIANDDLLRSSIVMEPDVSSSSSSSSAGSSSRSSSRSGSSSPSGSPSPISSNAGSDDEDGAVSSAGARATNNVADEQDESDGGGSGGEVITKNNITLPSHNEEIIHISVDIGGTLTKLVYFRKSRHRSSGSDASSGGGKIYFRDFQTENFKNEAMKFMIQLITKSISKQSKRPPITYIMATGGGAHKFYQLMTKTFRKRNLPMQIIAKDEMECLIRGLDWLITKIPQEIFIYDLQEVTTKFQPLQKENEIYPYLLVNIGSGVSMIKVTGPGPGGFERIGGSSLGGGTLWGLLSLLTDAKDYNEMLEMAQRGDNENIDLLVGDIYGTNYNKIGLKANHIASSFAKVFKKLRFTNENKAKPTSSAAKLAQFKQEDIARSLLFSISNNIGQIAYLQALRFNLKRIYFGGSYISGHMQTIHTLSFAVNFWSNGDMQSYFLRHEGFLGSVGAFMMGPAFNDVERDKQREMLKSQRNGN
ncbi:uncharacterized protein LODBEIA_P42040 [Lodderomyces beijingensis]|uniref:Pantothenate kinase n=1 Tax=Lodderomyces beijingensis TaxID=1775926 RepID=A0ABP0ZS07_9ASCO